jgi:hypothetical protein
MLDFDIRSVDPSYENDISKPGKIIRFIEPFPKVYICQYVNQFDAVVKKGKDKGKVKSMANTVYNHIRAKGFIRSASKMLEYDDFINLLVKSKTDSIDEKVIDDAFNQSKKPREILDNFKNKIGSLDFTGNLCSYSQEKFRRNVFSQKLVDAGKHSTIEIIQQSRCLGKNEWCKRNQSYDSEFTSYPKGYKYVFCKGSSEPHDKDLLIEIIDHGHEDYDVELLENPESICSKRIRITIREDSDSDSEIDL